MGESSKSPVWHVSRRMRGNARALRQNSTDAEHLIWAALRGHRLGPKFRRQVPVGPFIVDFVCYAARLVIELDGGQHFEASGSARDRRRDAFLRARGYEVLRFNNHDVMTNRDGVLETIAAVIGAAGSPLPDPPPQAGGGDPNAVPVAACADGRLPAMTRRTRKMARP